MKTAVRKLEVRDIEKLHALVIENVEGLEPGLTVLDYRLLLGHATIDAVARDTGGSLVLMAIGFTADEEMLLKAVEAYSWCLEYPEAIRRLYTGVELSEARPPRLIFVIERMPDSFHRKMKQLGFPDVDCVEFRLLDVDGAAAVYFDRLARLRRASVGEARHESASSAPVASGPENVIALGGIQRGGSSRLQKLLTQASAESAAPRPVERPAPARDVAPVVSMISRASVAPVPAAEPVVADGSGPVAVPATASREPTPSVPASPLAEPEVQAASRVPEAEVEAAEGEDGAARFEGLPALELASPLAETSDNVAESETPAPATVAAAGPAPEGIAFREVVPAEEPRPEMPPAAPEPKRVSFAEAAAKALLQQTRPTAVAQVEEGKPESSGEAKPAGAVPPGFEGLQFPGDGQLTRQWMEFLNQMAAAKK